MPSNRLAIGQALVSLISPITNPTTSETLYQKVKLGAFFDPSNMTSWCEIVHSQGKGGPEGSGGSQIGWRIKDQVTFTVTSGIGPYETDSTAAQENMLIVQDILLPTLRQHFQLPQAGAPALPVQGAYNVLIEQTDRSRPARFPNGHTYLLWDIYITVSQQYSLSFVQP